MLKKYNLQLHRLQFQIKILHLSKIFNNQPHKEKTLKLKKFSTSFISI